MIDKRIFSEQLEPKEQFMFFMKLIGLSYKSLVNYAADIYRCSELIQDELKQDGLSSLYDIRDQETIRRYQQILDNNKKFIAHNQTGNNRLSASVYNYIKFVDFLFVYSRKRG